MTQGPRSVSMKCASCGRHKSQGHCPRCKSCPGRPHQQGCSQYVPASKKKGQARR